MRIRRLVARALLGCVVMGVCAIAAVPIALRLPASRRVVVARVNATLAPVFAGRVVIEKIGAIGLTSVDGLDAHVDAPDGETVLRVRDVRARVSSWALLRSAVSGKGSIAVGVADMSVATAEVTVDTDEQGRFRVAEAFAPSPERARDHTPGRGVDVRIESVRVERGDVRLRLLGRPPMDVGLGGARATVIATGGNVSVDLDRTHVDMSGLPGEPPAHGEVEGHLGLPPLAIRAIWRGTVGALGETALFAYREGRVDGVLDVDRATPDELRTVWPDAPLAGPLLAHVEAHGTLPDLEVQAHAATGGGEVDVNGPVTIARDVHAALRFAVRRLDLHAIAPSAPASDFEATGATTIAALADGALEAKVDVALHGGRVGSIRVPPATLTAELARNPAGEPSGRADLSVAQPGAPTAVTARLVRRAGTLVVAFDAETTIPRLEALSLASGAVTGSGSAAATGTLDLAARSLDARFSATLGSVGVRGVSMDRARVDAQVRGSVAHPWMDVQADAEGVDAKGLHFSAAHGTGRVTFDDGVSARDVDLVVAGDGGAASVRAPLVRVSSAGVLVQDALVEGLGAPLTATLHASPSAVDVRATSDGVDLARVATFAAIPARRGKVSFQVDAGVGADGAHGRIALEAQGLSLPGIDDASGRIEAGARGRHVWGHATANVDGIGTVDVRSSGAHIGSGSLLAASPWRKTWGALRFAAHADLAGLAARLTQAHAAAPDLSGSLDLQGQVARESSDDATPEVEVSARTTDLAINGPVRVEGIDPSVQVTVDGDTGDTNVALEVRDSHGPLFKADAHSAAVPYAVVFSDGDPLEALASTPFDARAAVPARPMDSLPPLLHAGGVGGSVEGTLAWHGTLRDPRVDLTAALKGGRPLPSTFARKVDWTIGARYDGARLEATLQGATRKGRVVDASAAVEAKIADVLARLRGEGMPWKASGRVKLERFPLQDLTALDDKEIRGEATGEITLDGLHSDAQASMLLTLDGMQVGDTTCKTSNLSVRADGHAFDATVRFEQAEGVLSATAHVGARWGAAMAPTLDASQPGEVALSARQFHAALLLPFVSRWMSDVDGRIDADARLLFGVMEGGAPHTTPFGSITLRDGSFELSSFGGELHDVSGKLSFLPEGVVRLEDVTAKGVTGTVRAAATARLDGLSLSGVRATVALPAKDPLPLVFDNVQMGVLDGDFDLAVARDASTRGFGIAVTVPRAHLQLPAGRSSLDVQTLGGVSGVRVGRVDPVRGFVEVPLDGSRDALAEAAAAPKVPLKLSVDLGDVHVSRGKDLDVWLEGRPTITMDPLTRVAGQIRMPRGTIDVQGKKFSVERGTVTFVDGDPSNPQVLLTAAWDAPDGTHVYADFVGPLKTGKVKLRSDPAKTQSEILALILFGTDDGSVTPSAGQSTQPDVSPMAAAAAGIATQPLNRALDSLGFAGGISTRIDTSQANPRPEVEVQIARDISIQVAWALGMSTADTSGSTLVTLNWRFLRQWSLETTVADIGTSVIDVIWQHKY